jgi:hypothetical protein
MIRVYDVFRVDHRILRHVTGCAIVILCPSRNWRRFARLSLMTGKTLRSIPRNSIRSVWHTVRIVASAAPQTIAAGLPACALREVLYVTGDAHLLCGGSAYEYGHVVLEKVAGRKRLGVPSRPCDANLTCQMTLRAHAIAAVTF